MSDVKVSVELQEQISGPAAKAASAMQRLQRGVTGFTGNVVKAGKAFGGSAFGQALGRVLNIAKGFGLVELGIGVLGAKFGMDAATFKSESVQAFTLIEGSAQKANDTFNRIKQIADATPFTGEQVVSAFQALRGSGFGQREAETIFAAASDIASAQGKGREQSYEQLNHAILKLNSQGKLTADTLDMFGQAAAGSGGSAAFLEQLAKSRKTTVEQVRKDIEKGKINSGQALNALSEFAINKVNGGQKLGTATNLFGQATIAGQLSSLQENVGTLFQDIDVQPFVAALTKLNTVFQTDEAKEFAATVQQIFGEVASSLSDAIDVDTMRSIMAGLQVTVSVTWAALQMAFDGLYEGAKAAIGPVMELFGGFSVGAGTTEFMLDGLKGLAKAVGYVAAAFVMLSGALVFALAWLAAGVGFMLGHVGDLFDWYYTKLFHAIDYLTMTPWSQIGADIATGLFNGFKMAFNMAIAGIKGLVGLLPQAVKDVLGIHSPSRVMMELGFQTAEGFNIGTRQGVDASLYEGFAPSTKTIGDVTGSARGGTASIVVGDINITIQGGPNPMETAKLVGSEVRRQMLSVFDGLAIEAGAPA